jgi:hypothetical protein
VEARLEAEASSSRSTADEQKKTVLRLREELPARRRAGGHRGASTSSSPRRWSGVGRSRDHGRLRARVAAVAESIVKAESDVRARLDVALVEWERRQSDRLERVTEREVERHTQVAMLAFDERLREAREEAAARLQRELDRAVELLVREELAQRWTGAAARPSGSTAGSRRRRRGCSPA